MSANVRYLSADVRYCQLLSVVAVRQSLRKLIFNEDGRGGMHWPENWRPEMDRVKHNYSTYMSGLERDGCDYLAKLPWSERQQLCYSSYSSGVWDGLKPLSSFCPKSCQCPMVLYGIGEIFYRT